MATIEELRDVRLSKLNILKDKGINPYPAKADRDFSLLEINEKFNSLNSENKDISVVGRVMSIRGQGAILFVDIYDGTAKFQVVVKQDVDISYQGHDENGFEIFGDVVDMGDFINVTGTLFVTKRGEQSIEMHSWKMLTKTLLPIPGEHYGLKDDDERYRKRYLDILMNPELREIFKKKEKFWEVIRDFMKEKGFTEVETPTLEITTGGAEARPFKTHHNDFDIDVYLRISIGELWQKRLMSAGFPKTFEIGRAYRNEGGSQEHLQEFTNMEFYWSYANYRDGMTLVKELYRKIAQETFGTTRFETRGHSFDLADEWEEIDYVEKIKEMTGVDVLSADVGEMKDKLEELGVKYEGDNRERLTDTLWKYCRKKISGPAFLINHPILVAPLSKRKEDDPEKTEMFQPIIAGSEVGRGYSELNDPSDQRARFEEQQKLIESGDEEAMMPEWEFVEMLEHGMPPTCGYGFGERLFAFLIDKPLREVQMFPFMKPKE